MGQNNVNPNKCAIDHEQVLEATAM